jgi:hypothetical protein
MNTLPTQTVGTTRHGIAPRVRPGRGTSRMTPRDQEGIRCSAQFAEWSVEGRKEKSGTLELDRQLGRPANHNQASLSTQNGGRPSADSSIRYTRAHHFRTGVSEPRMNRHTGTEHDPHFTTPYVAGYQSAQDSRYQDTHRTPACTRQRHAGAMRQAHCSAILDQQRHHSHCFRVTDSSSRCSRRRRHSHSSRTSWE